MQSFFIYFIPRATLIYGKKSCFFFNFICPSSFFGFPICIFNKCFVIYLIFLLWANFAVIEITYKSPQFYFSIKKNPLPPSGGLHPTQKNPDISSTAKIFCVATKVLLKYLQTNSQTGCWVHYASVGVNTIKTFTS
jgi:hypothetical protein